MDLINSLGMALDVVFPILFLLLTGILLRKIKLVDDHSLTIMNKLVFRVFLMIKVFKVGLEADFDEIISCENFVMISFVFGVIILIVILSYFVWSRKIEGKKRCAIMIQGTYRSNLALFGLVVTSALYGERSAGAVALLIITIVPLYNIIAVILLQGVGNGEIRWRSMPLMIIKNPLVSASIVGITCNLIGVQVPSLIMNPITSMANVATPLAFIVLGASLQIHSIKRNFKDIVIISFLRLLVVPGFILFTAIAIGIQNVQFVALLGTMASPVGVASYAMAKEYNTEPTLAGEIVAFTSLFSIITMFFWIALFGMYGII